MGLSGKDVLSGEPLMEEGENEENEEELGYIIQLIINLVGDLEGTGITIFLDKAFSSIRLARLLASLGGAGVWVRGACRGLRVG